MVLLLIGCGGGSTDSQPTSPPETAPQPTTKISQLLTITVPSYLESTNQPLSLLGSSQAVLGNATNAGVITIEREDVDELVYMIDDQDSIQLIGFANEGDKSLEISPSTTAAVIVGVHPANSLRFAASTRDFYEYLSNEQPMIDLAIAIDKTPDWAEFDDDEIINAYVNAVIHAIEANESATVADNANKIDTLLTLQANKAVKIVPPSTKTQDGVEVVLTGPNIPELEPDISLEVTNQAERYVAMSVGKSSHQHGINHFVLGPQSTQYGSVKEVVKSALFVESMDQQNYIYAYGPSMGLGAFVLYNEFDPDDDGGERISDQENEILNAYTDAVVMTLLHYQVIPYIAASYRANGNCLLEKWIQSDDEAFPRITAPLSQGEKDLVINAINILADSPDGIKRGYWEAATLLSPFITGSDITSCLANDKLNDAAQQKTLDEAQSKFIEIILPLFSKIINRAISWIADEEKLEAFTKLEPSLIATLSAMTSPQSRWDISAVHTPDLDRLSIDPHFFNADNEVLCVGSSIICELSIYDPYKYAGICPENAYCNWAVYERKRPSKPVGLKFNALSCLNSDTSTERCRNIVVKDSEKGSYGGSKDFPQIDENGDFNGQIGIEIDYGAEVNKILKGQLSVADLDGSYADYAYIYKLSEAQPKPVIFIDDKRHEENDIYVFQCGNEDSIESKNITIKNEGVGNYFMDYRMYLVLGAFEIAKPFEPTLLAAGKSAKGVLEYTCDSDSSQIDQAYVEISDEFSDSDAFKETIVFKVDVEPKIEYKIIGFWDWSGSIEIGQPADSGWTANEICPNDELKVRVNDTAVAVETDASGFCNTLPVVFQARPGDSISLIISNRGAAGCGNNRLEICKAGDTNCQALADGWFEEGTCTKSDIPYFSGELP